jgi:hypothetical protein
MRGRIEVVSAQPKSGSHDGLIENRWAGIDEQLGSPRGFQDAPHITSIHPNQGNRIGPQEMVCSFQIAVPACNLMTLSKQ